MNIIQLETSIVTNAIINMCLINIRRNEALFKNIDILVFKIEVF